MRTRTTPPRYAHTRTTLLHLPARTLPLPPVPSHLNALSIVACHSPHLPHTPLPGPDTRPHTCLHLALTQIYTHTSCRAFDTAAARCHTAFPAPHSRCIYMLRTHARRLHTQACLPALLLCLLARFPPGDYPLPCHCTPRYSCRTPRHDTGFHLRAYRAPVRAARCHRLPSPHSDRTCHSCLPLLTLSDAFFYALKPSGCGLCADEPAACRPYPIMILFPVPGTFATLHIRCTGFTLARMLFTHPYAYLTLHTPRVALHHHTAHALLLHPAPHYTVTYLPVTRTARYVSTTPANAALPLYMGLLTTR